MISFKQAVNDATKQLEAKGITGQNALLLMLELANKESYDLYLHYEDIMEDTLFNTFQEGIHRLLEHVPLSYVLGYSWFYGYKLIVDGGVLIPRVETEELVGNVLAEMDQYFKDYTQIDAVDIGCGSGAIAISIVCEEPKVSMIATDISEEALVVAKKNAINNKAHIEFLKGNMAQPLIDCRKKVDFLICNPPYIPAQEELDCSVKDYEPHVALFGGEDGLKFYRMVFEAAPQVLKERAIMAFEIGYDQKETLLSEAHKYFPNNRAEVLQDMFGKDRLLFIYFNV